MLMRHAPRRHFDDCLICFGSFAMLFLLRRSIDYAMRFLR